MAVLGAVDAAYHAADSDRRHSERALQLSSQELMQANAELRAVLRAFPDCFVWIDADDKVVRVQPGEVCSPDLCADAWLGRPVGDLPLSAAVPLRATLDRVRATGVHGTVEFTVGASCFEARLLPLFEGQVLAILRDISARRREEELLRQAKEAALKATRAKSDFLAIMSHEIRTPLNAVIGMHAVLERTELDAEQRDCVDTARVAGETLLALIDDILDLSRLEAGKPVLDDLEFAVQDCVKDVAAMLGETARRKGLNLSVDFGPGVPDAVRGDPVRLRQVLLNLVGNAIKFTEAGGVAVRVCGALQGGSSLLRFEVADTGIGLSVADGERLFQPFSRGDGSTTRRFGGTGLGLAISKRIVGMMGGEIGFHGAPGAGTTFWFTVLCRHGERAAAEEAASRSPARNLAVRGHVLVVEDNAVNQKVARMMLQRLGCEVEVAGGGCEAMARLAAGRYDAVLMDCQMPDVDGYAVTRELRAREGSGRRTPVIAFTANASAEDLARCREAGMDDCITKPVRMETLTEVLWRWLPASQPVG